MANSYVNDVAPAPARPSYFKIYPCGPQSDVEFKKSMSSANVPTAADGLSHRQLYLNSYTFSREEDHKTVKCPARAKDQPATDRREGSSGRGRGSGTKFPNSCFWRLLSCAVKLEVDD